MKKLLMAVIAASTLWSADAAEAKKAEAATTTNEVIELEEEDDDLPFAFWGFGNYGMYSGYQLYGSLLNSEPTMSGYVEGNVSILPNDIDLGYLGIGIWSNSDLTDKRRDLYGKAFNEWDFNIHWGRVFWFDDEKQWGLDYRTEVVWYYYPHGRGHDYNSHGKSHFQYGRNTMTTMDWNHAFELKNPYVIPYFKWVHEYHENKANLWLGGFKKTIEVCNSLTMTPIFEMVYRSSRYNWCFPTAGWTELHGSGMASTKLGVDFNYAITKNFGLFAKVYWCHLVDHSLRAAADHGNGGDYGQYKDFAWGGFGATFNF